MIMANELRSALTTFPIVPHASTNHPRTARAIYVGGAGNIALVNKDDTVTLFTAVPVGTTIYASSKRVNAVNTTATLLVGLA